MASTPNGINPGVQLLLIEVLLASNINPGKPTASQQHRSLLED